MDQFYDVFSHLKIDSDFQNVLNRATVEKVSTNSDKNRLRIYVNFDAPIPKRRIWKLEDEIRKQYFGRQEISVSIIETFTLSAQYDAKKLYEIYSDSILEEIYRKNTVIYGLLKKSEIAFSDHDTMEITMEDTVIAREKAEDIRTLFYRIFTKRCGQKFELRFQYKEAKKSKYTVNSEKLIEDMVADITRRTENGSDAVEDTFASESKASGKAGAKGAKETGAAGTEARNKAGKGGFERNGGNGSFHRNGGSREGGNNGGGRRRSFGEPLRSSDPNVIYGGDVEDAYFSIEEIRDEIGAVTIHGEILECESRTLKDGERALMKFHVSDHTDSIGVVIFTSAEELPEMEQKLAVGTAVALTGNVRYDDYSKDLTIGSVRGIKKISFTKAKREDHGIEKRVELHCHTKMSDMDGVSYAKDIIRQAQAFGHKAIAITDHGVVHAFPEAMHAAEGSEDFKVIYGVEAYLVDDEKTIAKNPKGQTLEASFVVFDIETTGFSASKNRIIEIGAVRVEKGEITDRFSEFVDPEVPIPYRITELTSITDDMVMGQKKIEEILPRFMEFSRGAVMVAHNADFDMSFISENCRRQELPCNETYVDTVELSKLLFPHLKNYKLDTVAEALGVTNAHHHRAVDDAECTAQFFVKELVMLSEMQIHTLEELNAEHKLTDDAVKKLHQYHAIILAKNDIGRINLYRLVSESQLKYLHRLPKMPRSLIRKYREGLILGSACSEGELYEAILNGRPAQEIARIAGFYA